MPNQRGVEQVAITIYIPRSLRAAIRVRTRERGDTVTDILTRELKRYVGLDEPT